MALQNVHNLVPRMSHCITFHSQRHNANMIQLKIQSNLVESHGSLKLTSHSRQEEASYRKSGRDRTALTLKARKPRTVGGILRSRNRQAPTAQMTPWFYPGVLL